MRTVIHPRSLVQKFKSQCFSGESPQSYLRTNNKLTRSYNWCTFSFKKQCLSTEKIPLSLSLSCNVMTIPRIFLVEMVFSSKHLIHSSTCRHILSYLHISKCHYSLPWKQQNSISSLCTGENVKWLVQ